MKTIDGSSKIKFLFLVMLSFIMMSSCYIYHNYATYQSIGVVVNKSATIEYGSANYDINKLVKEVDGEIVSIKKDIDTNVVGEQEIIVEVKKDNVIKDVPFIVVVVDSVAPVIRLKDEKITIKKGDNLDLDKNIISVVDEVDGDITYLDNPDGREYYNFSYVDDINAVGSHVITVKAVDKSGNTAVSNFTLEVLEPEPEPIKSTPVFVDLPANSWANDLVLIANSLVGLPYVSGANGPYGFDCSGLVQYIYSQVGINISRTSSTQLHDGVSVSYQDAQPGDILSWGTADGVATHSALYVGDGQMIHATNPRQGVIKSDVATWTRGSGTRVISVRRIK